MYLRSPILYKSYNVTFVFPPPVLSLYSPELPGSISHSGLLSASLSLTKEPLVSSFHDVMLCATTGPGNDPDHYDLTPQVPSGVPRCREVLVPD